MNSETPNTPREEMEARLTALLLGELSAEEAASVRDAIAQDVELTQLHERLKQTVGLVRETVASPVGELAAKPEELKLSAGRREKLLQHFKTKRTPEPTHEVIVPRRRWQMPWFVPMSAAAALMVVAGATLLVPTASLTKKPARLTSLPGASEAPPRTIAVVPSRLVDGTLSVGVENGVAAGSKPAQTVDGDADGEVAGESVRKSQWFSRGADFKSALATPPPPRDLPAAPALPAEPKPQVLSVVVLPETKSEVAQVTANFETSPAASEDFLARADDVAGVPVAQKGKASAHFGGMAVRGFAGGGMGGAEGFAGRGEQELVERLPAVRLSEESERLERPSTAAIAPQPVPPPATPPPAVTAPVSAGSGTITLYRMADTPPANGPAPASAMGRSLNESVGKKLSPAKGVEVAQTISRGANVADPEPREELKARKIAGAVPARPGVAVAQSLAEAKEPALRQLERAKTDSLAAISAFDALGVVDGQPVAIAKGDKTMASAGEGIVNLGDAPVLGMRFQAGREFFDDSKATPAKPGAVGASGAKFNDAFFAQGTLSDGGALAKQRPADSAASDEYTRLDLFADFGNVADQSGQTKDAVKELADQSTKLYFGTTDRHVNGRDSAQGRDATRWGFDAGLADLEQKIDGRKQALEKDRAEVAVAEKPAQSAGGVYSVNAVGYVNVSGVTNAQFTELANHWDENQMSSGLAAGTYALNPAARPEARQETEVRRRATIALPQIKAEEGRPVGERSAGRTLARAGVEVAKVESVPASPTIESRAKQVKSIDEVDAAAKRPASAAPIPQPEVRTGDNAFSTFSLNVSDVSFKLAAASLEKGSMPDAASVRSEEFINAFDYRDPEPAGAPLAFAWERARYPFAQNRDLLRLSVKTAAAGRQPGRPLNLVLLLDNSGSMERADRVRIIQQCLRVLAGQLRPEDRLSVVTFARTPRLWIDGVPGNQAAQIAEHVSGLTPQGGTNLEEAMNLAYQTALRHYLASGVNRVVLLTDGAANLGDLQPASLQKKVEAYRKQGIALDCFGIGWDGYNDDLLEVLSRNGDGRYGFVNTPEAAYVEFAGQLAGALKVAASDVKVQVEFNPKRVTAYRQIGYAKHQLKKEQFRDNTVDAAEIGAAEAGNALYVIEVNPRGEGPLAVVRVRFKVPGTTDYREHEWTVPFTGPAVALDKASPAMRLAATASGFSEWLVSSPFAAEVAPDALLNQMRGVPEVFGADARPKKLEWMIRQAKSVAGR